MIEWERVVSRAWAGNFQKGGTNPWEAFEFRRRLIEHQYGELLARQGPTTDERALIRRYDPPLCNDSPCARLRLPEARGVRGENGVTLAIAYWQRLNSDSASAEIQTEEVPTDRINSPVEAVRSAIVADQSSQGLQYRGRYVFRNPGIIHDRAYRTEDPRHIFYAAMQAHNTYEAYEAAVGRTIVRVATIRGSRPVSGNVEMRYARKNGWIADAGGRSRMGIPDAGSR